MKAHILIIVGPSGVGKTAIEQRLQQEGYRRSVSVTTREKRSGEVQGVDYDFVSPETFSQMEFLETYNRKGTQTSYGTPLVPVIQARDANQKMVMVLEREGVRQVRSKLKLFNIPFAVCHILPCKGTDAKCLAVLEERMIKRGDSENHIKERMDYIKKQEELKFFEDLYDKQFVNEDIGVLIRELLSYADTL